MKLYAMTCGRLTGRMKDMMEGEEGEVTLPIPSYLIEHPKGRVLLAQPFTQWCLVGAQYHLLEHANGVARLRCDPFGNRRRARQRVSSRHHF